MKKLFFLLIISLSISINANAQLFLGTKSLYHQPVEGLTALPDGYKPVFINHVGRHGARHLTKEVNTAYGYMLLAKADSADALTSQGKLLWQMVKNLNKVEKGKVKSISIEGKDELKGIAQRMYANQATLFAYGANLNVTETKEIRTKQSADAFLAGLTAKMVKQPTIKEYIDDTNLRFYDFSPVYIKFEEEGEWLKSRETLAKAIKAEQVTDAVVNRFFTSKFLLTVGPAKRDKFVSDIFGFATISYSLKQEILQADLGVKDVAIMPLFTPREINTLADLDQADDYYAKGPSLDPNGIQARIAAPLLVNFINTTDDFIKNGTYTAQLRFAHAETISPFATLLNISIADKPTMAITDIGKVWQAANVIPLSANIQWIFYKNDKGNYLVKILLNEKEARITGVPVIKSAYYDWDTLRKFYINKLQKLGVGLGDDMSAYLKNVK